MQRTVQNAVTYNEGDTVWNSFMRCRLLNYLVHGTIPQFICIFLSLSQICLYFFAFSSIRICYSYDFWHRIISENLVWYWFINPFLGSSCFLSSFWMKKRMRLCFRWSVPLFLSIVCGKSLSFWWSVPLFPNIVCGKSLSLWWSVPSFLAASSLHPFLFFFRISFVIL